MYVRATYKYIYVCLLISDWSFDWLDCFMYENPLQDDTLEGDASTLDLSTKSNLENLIKLGEKMLTNRVMQMNIDTGTYEPAAENINNDEQLKRWLISFKCFYP